MSALGQKQTYAVHNRMSALPPKADMCSAEADVCFGPKADIATGITHRSALGYKRRAIDEDQATPFERRPCDAGAPGLPFFARWSVTAQSLLHSFHWPNRNVAITSRNG